MIYYHHTVYIFIYINNTVLYLISYIVLGTLLGRSNDAHYNGAAREEARFRKAEWDNYLCHGPRGQAEYHHGFEHCI